MLRASCVLPEPGAESQRRLRDLLTEATDNRRRGDEAVATYLEMLAAVWIRTAEIQGRAA